MSEVETVSTTDLDAIYTTKGSGRAMMAYYDNYRLPRMPAEGAMHDRALAQTLRARARTGPTSSTQVGRDARL